MYLDLLPEFVGLMLTPAAIAGCILLLQSQHPYGNAVAFATAFLVIYAVISIVVLAIGDTVEPTAATAHAAGVVGIAIGGLFLLVGAAVAAHHKQTGGDPPKWATMLEHARPTGAFIVGLVLAAANPNLFILLSGLGIVVTDVESGADRVGGTVFLLFAVALDFVIPVVLFAVFGDRARRWLDSGRRWMIGHDRPLTLLVLFGFGALFLLRGITKL